MTLADAADRSAALTDFDHNLVVTAGAGTGKTSLLTGRVLCALIGRQLAAGSLLVTTFTEKAAGEMAERLEESLTALTSGAATPGSDAARAGAALREHFALAPEEIARRASALLDAELPVIETFHAFCLRVLTEFARDAELPPDLRIAGEIDVDELFEGFWLELLDRELGPARESDTLLELDVWATLIENPGLEACKEALREWCRRPFLDELELDLEVEPLRRALRELLPELEELAAANRQPPKFQDLTLPALATARRLLELADGQRPTGESLRECRGYGRREYLPTISKRTPEPARSRLKELQRELQRNLRAWSKLPDREAVRSLESLCRLGGRRFERRKAARGVVTFEDCLVRCYRLLRDRPAARERLIARFAQILVDEFQDTDPLQYDILFFLAQSTPPVAGEDPRRLSLAPGRLCIVGDPKQSIYRFRGADMEAFDRAARDVLAQDGRELHLTVNFRSRGNVLDLVNRCVGPLIVEDRGFQPPYEPLESASQGGGDGDVAGRLLHVTATGTALERRQHEARAIGARILSETRPNGRRRFRDFALLFRAFTEADVYGRELRQLRIPVLIEGGKRFYERHEVERLLAVLRVILRPHDEAAVLACLRSHVAAVPDAELAACADAGLSPGQILIVSTDRLRGAPERVRAAAARLRDLRRFATGRTPSELLRYLVHEDLTGALEAAGYDGAQRLANLEALTEKVTRWSVDGFHDLEEVVERLTREARGLAEAEESPLADPGTDAVRLMTIHKAKGLEFDVVVLPDLARESFPGKLSDRFHVIRDEGGRDRILLNLETTQSPLFAELENRAARHEEAEELRLVYVALTRARDEIVLSCTRPGQRRAPWTAVLDQLGIDLRDPPDSGSLKRGLIYERVGDTETKHLALAPGVDLEPIARAVQERADYERSLPGRLRPPLRAPSGAIAAGDAPPRAETLPSSPFPLAVGSTVHDYLRACDFSSDRLDEERLRALAAGHARRVPEADAGKRITDSSAEVLRAFLGSALRERLSRARVLARELPVLYRDDDGRRWHGSIDLLFEENGRLVVADYKTDRVEEEELEAHAEPYRAQMQVYVHATARAWELAAEPAAELLFLRAGRAVVL